jgi:hypothetical protein
LDCNFKFKERLTSDAFIVQCAKLLKKFFLKNLWSGS